MGCRPAGPRSQSSSVIIGGTPAISVGAPLSRMRGAFISSFPLSNRRAASPGADHATHRNGCSGNSMRPGRFFFKNGPQTSTRRRATANKEARPPADQRGFA
jgi:hypothetical protein